MIGNPYLTMTAHASATAEEFRRLTTVIARAFNVPIRLLWIEPERPVDRARRLRVERAMRARYRRAYRHNRLEALR